MPMTREQLLLLRDTVPPMDLRIDIRDVELDPHVPAPERMEEYLRQIKNPYYFRCGDIAVHVQFSSDGKPLRDVLAQCLAAAEKRC